MICCDDLVFANVRRLLVALILAGSGLALGPTPVQAVQPVPCPQQTTQQHVMAADAIFTGVVKSSERGPVADAQPGSTFTHEVAVDLVYKGDVTTSTVQVRTDQSRVTCSLGKLATGTSYMFFVQPDGEIWTAAGASGTAPASDELLAKVERLLGAGNQPVPPAPETATFTTVGAGEPTTLTRAAAPGLALIIIGLLGLAVAGRIGSRRG